jgi:hypothetical protein
MGDVSIEGRGEGDVVKESTGDDLSTHGHTRMGKGNRGTAIETKKEGNDRGKKET